MTLAEQDNICRIICLTCTVIGVFAPIFCAWTIADQITALTTGTLVGASAILLIHLMWVYVIDPGEGHTTFLEWVVEIGELIIGALIYSLLLRLIRFGFLRFTGRKPNVPVA